MKRLKVNLTNELDLGTCCMHWRIGVLTSPSYPNHTRDPGRGKRWAQVKQIFDIAREDNKLSVLFFFLSCLPDLHLKKDIRRGLDPFDRFPSSILSSNYSHIAEPAPSSSQHENIIFSDSYSSHFAFFLRGKKERQYATLYYPLVAPDCYHPPRQCGCLCCWWTS